MTSVVDAHAHLWDRSRFTYDWLDDEPELPAVFLPEHLRAAGADIDGFIFVQADCLEKEGWAEASWIQSLKPSTPELSGIVAFAPLEKPYADFALGVLESIPLVVGVRRLLQGERVEFFELDSLGAGLDAVARRGWTFDACVRWHQLGALANLASRHEDLPIVVDHLGKPPLAGGPEEFEAWRTALAAVAALPNTTVKLSGLPAEAAPGAGLDLYRDWLVAVLELFGPERAMVGTDWPVSSATNLNRADWFELVRDATGVTAGEWTQLAALTAERVYRLPRAG
ncbi:amidohydrolase family protein [Microbacterium sp. 4R-513]|uniref:amidohydrolase family protein n=1 Tax=Microbacterium sp. 4R-513 TaxID=2567934 RepID=UPI0013E1796A|nr:amidohydrolase family protein [Microbacterium sp. 4R-513]QIG39419.1 amidohydrolase family protein [Microbacterium sp. 4R-513]